MKPDELWPDALLLMAGAAQAGASLEDALESLAREAPEPLRAAVRARLEGVPARAGFRGRAEAVFASAELAAIRAALLLCHESGAPAAPSLEAAAQVLRSRRQFAERVEALTAQARMSAWIVGAAPAVIAGALTFLAPELMAPMFTTAAGWAILGAAAAMVGGGLALVHRLSRVEP